MNVKEIMHENPKVIYPNTSVKEAAIKMKEINSGFLPVCNTEKIVGVITDRDIVLNSIASEKDLSEIKAEDIMTKGVVYCFEEDSIESAAKQMEMHKVRRLAVINKDKKLTGILSISDIAAKGGNKQLAGEIMEKVSESSVH